MSGIVHIVGPVTDIGPRRRQRCTWCGTILLDYDLTRIALQRDDDAAPAFPAGALLEVDGNCRAVLAHEDGAPLPANACDAVETEAARTALAIADRVAAEEPTAGAGRVTRRLIAALREADLVHQGSGRPDLTGLLQQMGIPVDEIGRVVTNVRVALGDPAASFNEDKLVFRIMGDLVHAAPEVQR